MIQVNRIYLIFNRLVTKKFLVDTSEAESMKTEIFSGSISSKLSLDEILDYLDVDDKYKWMQNGNVITITDK
jgi:hypothetical protein